MADAVEITLESPDFNCERVWVNEISGVEAISRLFDFDVDIVVRDGALELDEVSGASVSIVFSKDGIVVRRIHGMVATVIDQLDTEGANHTYKLHVVPHAHGLSLIELLEVQVDVTVPQIIKAKLDQIGLDGATELRLGGTYPSRDFVVQYKESDLAFVSRLTEHLGISFFFDQTETEDRIVFTDHAGGFGSLEEHVKFRGRGEKHDVYALARRRDVIPNLYVVQDYNYRSPLVDLSATHELAAGFAGGVVDFGSHVKTPKEAEGVARIRSEERQAMGHHYTGSSDLPALSPGHYMTIDGHPKLESGEQLIVSVRHHARQAMFDGQSTAAYTNEFVCVPRQQGYRPPRRTPRPRMTGVATGIVDGGLNPGSAELARIDDQGRYYVRLVFDTAMTGQRHASHPIRMAQPSAGPGYGQHFPLRPGVEVIVLFVDGDPDRPIIAGAVPNPLNPSPVVAADATVNRIKTQSGIVIEMHDR